MQLSIFGLDTVGAVAAGCLAAQGHTVIAVDTDAVRVDRVSRGLAPVSEPGLETLIKEAVESSRLKATSDVAEAIGNSALSSICIGDFAQLAALYEEIGAAVRVKSKFHAVVQRSALRPGAMREALIPALERASGKRAGTDFGIGICPEFLRRGSAIEDYRNPPAIILGVSDDETLARLREMDIALQAPELVVGLDEAEAMMQAGDRRSGARLSPVSQAAAWPAFPLVADNLHSR